MTVKTIQDRSRPMEILLVEDSKTEAVLIQKSFAESKVPHNITVASDGQITLSILQKKGEYAKRPLPDIVLLDLSLPKISGKDVLKAIKDSVALKHIPVIVLTGSDGEMDVIRSYHLHANGYVVKPRDHEGLQKMIQRIAGFWMDCVVLPDEASVVKYNAI